MQRERKTLVEQELEKEEGKERRKPKRESGERKIYFQGSNIPNVAKH